MNKQTSTAPAKKLLVTAEAVLHAADTITITGTATIPAGRQHPTHFVSNLRDGNTYSVIPLLWEADTWTAHMPLETDLFTRGVWDFYLQDDVKRYRIKATAETILPSGEQPLLQQGGSGSMKLDFYQTVKGSLSMKAKLANLTLARFAVQRNEADTSSVQVTGALADIASISDAATGALVLVQRGTGAAYRIPVPFDADGQFAVALDYKAIMPIDTLLNTRWDVFLELETAETVHLFRCKISNTETLEADSKYVYKPDAIYEMFFYRTVNGNLSLHFKKLQIVRALAQAVLDGDTLQLQGFGYLESISFTGSTAPDRTLVVQNRTTRERLEYPLPGSVQTELDSLYDHAGFAITLSLKEIAALGTTDREKYDFYIRIVHEDASYERKIGFEEFTYYKDEHLGASSFKTKGSYVSAHTSVTPGGNLLLKIQMLSMAQHLYLKFEQKKQRRGGNEIWLIGERPDTAQDTGYHFFKYMRTEHPEIDTYYVIDPQAADAARVKELGNVLEANSLKHLRVAAAATAFIGSHDLEYIMPLDEPAELDRFRNGKRVFLQHGVFGRKNVEYHKYYYRYPFQLFCVSSTAEQTIIEDVLEYEPEAVQVTGLSRFDALLEAHPEKRSILVMPTWRDWLTTDEAFARSAYLERYRALLADERLQALLAKHDLMLDFYPHYRMQPYIEQFQALAGPRVHIIQQGDKRVQDLLMETKMLVTDYSSVSFDANYMGKPVVFYHFDREAFFKNGMLRPLEETFLGDVVKSTDQVVDAIADAIERDFAERPDVAERKELIFDHVDQHNCERIYQAIMQMPSGE